MYKRLAIPHQALRVSKNVQIGESSAHLLSAFSPVIGDFLYRKGRPPHEALLSGCLIWPLLPSRYLFADLEASLSC